MMVGLSKMRSRESKANGVDNEHVHLLNEKPSLHYRNLRWDELPAWRRDDRYIQTGYRQATHSYKAALASLTYLHNQTANIYSHFLAVPALMLSTGLLHSIRDVELHYKDYWIFSLFLIGVSTCFWLSTTFHTLSCHSSEVHHFWVRMDYAGIVVLTTTTFLAGEYYLFFCDGVRLFVHSTLTTSLGCTTIFVILTPRLQGIEWRTFRLTCFCLMGLSGFLPMIDSLLHYGLRYSLRYSIGYYAVEMLFEFLGAITYGSRVPERYWPGKFDIWGSSHQWFHVFSIAAAFVHLAGLVNAARNTRGSNRCNT